MAVQNVAPTLAIQTMGSAWDALARVAGTPNGVQSSLPDTDDTTGPAVSLLSREQLWSTLTTDGMTADADMLALAETFSRVGAPIDEATLSAARALMARMPEVKPAAIALATMLGVGKSTASISALSQFLDGLPTDEAATEVAAALSIMVVPDIDRNALAAAIRNAIATLSRSTENRLLSGATLTADARTRLLTLAAALGRERGDAAVSIAGHATAQQLMNQASIARFDPPVPLYFAFYIEGQDGNRTPAELQVWSRPDEDNSFARESATSLNVTIRVSPSALGLLQAVLCGTIGGAMTCTLSAERLYTYRLIRRHASQLAAALTAAGWEVRAMDVTHSTEFTPLWYGGTALSQPRSRIDRKA